MAETPLWALRLLAAAELAAEELACEPPRDHAEGCDRCAWEQLASAAPAADRVRAAKVSLTDPYPIPTGWGPNA